VRLARGGEAQQGRAEIERCARRVDFKERGRNEIDAQGALVDRALPGQLDPSKPAISELGDGVAGLIRQNDIGRHRSNAGPRQLHKGAAGNTPKGRGEANSPDELLLHRAHGLHSGCGTLSKGIPGYVADLCPKFDPAGAKALLAETGYPNGFDAGDLYPWPPYFSTGEAIISYLGAIGIRARLRTMERAAFYAALGTKKLKGLCMCVNAVYGNASSRLSETVPSDGAFAYGGYPDIDDLYKQQANETNAKKREAMLHQIQQTLHDRMRFAPIYDYIWASGLGPRVEDAALMKIDPYPWAAPLEELRLKRP